MNHYTFFFREFFLSILFLIHFSVQSQTNFIWKTPVGASQKLFIYRKNIVSETFNFVLTNTDGNSTIKVLNPRAKGYLSKFSFPHLNDGAVLAAFNGKLWVANHSNIEAYDLLNGQKTENIFMSNETDKNKNPNYATYTIEPESFVLPDMINNPKPFKVNLYRGHFERGGVQILKEITVRIIQVIYFKKFGSPTVFVVTESHKVFHRVKRVFSSCDSVKNSEKLRDHKICQRTTIF